MNAEMVASKRVTSCHIVEEWADRCVLPWMCSSQALTIVCVCVFVLLWEQNRFFPVLAIEVGGINDKGKVPRTRPATAY